MGERPILITGGGGFIGSTLAKRLVERDVDVIVLDDFSCGRRTDLPNGVTVIEADCRDADALGQATKFKPGAVVHLAAKHYKPWCTANPKETYDINVGGTFNVLRAVSDVPGCRLIFASSAAVYGPNQEPHAEDEQIEPSDVYGRSKALDEAILKSACRDLGIGCVIMRFFNVFGESDRTPHILPEILSHIDKPGPIPIGNLNTVRDYVAKEDVAAAIDLVLTKAHKSNGMVYNVGSSRGHSVQDLINIIGSATGHQLQIEQRGDLKRVDNRPCVISDCSSIRKSLGWKPTVSLEDYVKLAVTK